MIGSVVPVNWNSEKQRECPVCHGSDDCRECDGTGKARPEPGLIATPATGTQQPCTVCRETGKCYYCDGTGHVCADC